MRKEAKLFLIVLLSFGISCNVPFRILGFHLGTTDRETIEDSPLVHEFDAVPRSDGYFETFLPSPSEYRAVCEPNSETGPFDFTLSISIDFDDGSKVSGTLHAESTEEENTPSGTIIRRFIVDEAGESDDLYYSGAFYIFPWNSAKKLVVTYPDGKSRTTDETLASVAILGQMDKQLETMVVCIHTCEDAITCDEEARDIFSGGIQNHCMPYSLYECRLSRVDNQ